ncbi:dienelactone hydrolase family protein [Sphingomonas yunnanensis]|uniref:dienelactone hydrolase family protein n=1 Tax=Sphingomonas yunnanensis TaxID=310400 RepID=UPI001CA622BB|nr:dienelactone hydrolase family protein [Sphingomonas yunnanensis]MBY9065076.1 dienelactone hydrolase family protein [Sphingomonas yunnanensis]
MDRNDPELRDAAVRLYDDFTHEHRDRRTLLRQMTALAGSAAAAEALILGIAASPARAAQIDPSDKRLSTRKSGFTLPGGGSITGYVAAPRAAAGKLGAVMVIHENRGLQPHIEDVARRVALAGFFAFAPDFLSSAGGTPADEDKARELIGRLDYDATIATAVAVVKQLGRRANGNGKVGTVGFCWGGALVDRVALAAGPALAAGVSYYGPAPDSGEAARLQVPLLLHYAGKDTRVAQTAEPWVAALRAADKPFEAFTYPGVDHAFNNDTSAERYNKQAADLAWQRTTTFLHQHLDA